MNILFATNSIKRGGKERQMFILARTLMNNGNKLKILTKNINSDNYLNEYGLDRNTILEYTGKGWLNKFRKFKQILLCDSPELVVSWDPQTSLYSLLLYKKVGFKFINASIQHGIRLMRLSHFFRSLVCYLSPYIVANSHAGLKANNLKPGKDRFVLYNGIEDIFFNDLSHDDIQKKRIDFIPGYSHNPGTVYVSVANLVPYKDYFTVLKALNELKKHKSFYYFIIGDGPMRETIARVIKEYGLGERVFLTGRIENVSDYLFISNIMIHSSRGEGVSNAILEGMYAGLPVIASHVGGIPETVYSGSSMLFPYKDDNALLDCLLAAPDVFAGFNPKSEEYNKHLNKFSLKTMAKRFEEIIDVVINSN